MCPPVAEPATYSLSETPIRNGRHSKESDPPVEMAMLGNEPSLELAGSRRFGMTFAWFATMFTFSYTRRHFPVWTTRVTLPLGAQGISKCPLASVGAPMAATFAGRSWVQPHETGIFCKSGSGELGSRTNTDML